jgi:low molecular weight phosphotyrosine protein phosphatase
VSKGKANLPQIHTSDFNKFDYIFAMDRTNLTDLERIQDRVKGTAKVMLFGEYSGKQKAEEVQDPYYGGKSGFDTAYEQSVRFTNK